MARSPYLGTQCSESGVCTVRSCVVRGSNHFKTGTKSCKVSMNKWKPLCHWGARNSKAQASQVPTVHPTVPGSPILKKKPEVLLVCEISWFIKPDILDYWSVITVLKGCWSILYRVGSAMKMEFVLGKSLEEWGLWCGRNVWKTWEEKASHLWGVVNRFSWLRLQVEVNLLPGQRFEEDTHVTKWGSWQRLLACEEVAVPSDGASERKRVASVMWDPSV